MAAPGNIINVGYIMDRIRERPEGGGYGDDEAAERDSDRYEEFIRREVLPMCRQIFIVPDNIPVQMINLSEREFTVNGENYCTVSMREYLVEW